MAKRAGTGGGPVPPPNNAKAQELIDAVNALAYGVNSLAEILPEFMDKLEVVSQQYAVLIASEADRRHISADKLAGDMLANLANRVFGQGAGRRR